MKGIGGPLLFVTILGGATAAVVYAIQAPPTTSLCMSGGMLAGFAGGGSVSYGPDEHRQATEEFGGIADPVALIQARTGWPFAGAIVSHEGYAPAVGATTVYTSAVSYLFDGPSLSPGFCGLTDVRSPAPDLLAQTGVRVVIRVTTTTADLPRPFVQVGRPRGVVRATEAVVAGRRYIVWLYMVGEDAATVRRGRALLPLVAS